MIAATQPEGLFLEIGVGANDFVPLPTPLVGIDRKVTPLNFKENNRYLGIDMPLRPERYWRGIHAWFVGADSEIDEKSVESSGQIVEKFARLRTRLEEFRRGDNIDFAVADGQHLPLPDKRTAQVYMANVLGSQMGDVAAERLLAETHRVLVPGGRLVIRENITPQWVPENFGEMLEAAGFQRPVIHPYGSEAYDELAHYYGMSPGDVLAEYERQDHFFAMVER